MKDVVIIGGGPAGILASYFLQRNEVENIILERRLVGNSWRMMRSGMILLSPAIPGSDWTSLTLKQPIWSLPSMKRPFPTKDDFICYLEKFVMDNEIPVMEYCDVTGVKKAEGGFEVGFPGGSYHSKFVIVATGSYNKPRFLDIEGLTDNPSVVHSSDYFNCMTYFGKKVLVVGGGNSAAEIAAELSGIARVTLLSRGSLKFFTETDDLADIRGLSESILKELIKFKIIEHIEDDNLREVEGGMVTFTSGKRVAYDRIILGTGFIPSIPRFEGLKVSVDGEGLPDITGQGESVSSPGIFFVGSLALFNERCKFIHGFRNEVEKITWAIFDRL